MTGENRKASRTNRVMIGVNVKWRRAANGWTQQQLADRMCVVVSYVSNVEQGRNNLSLSTMERLADGLMCSVAALVGGRRDTVRGSGGMAHSRKGRAVRSQREGQTYRSVIADNIRRLRAVRGLTRRQLAERSGFSVEYIGDVECGRLNLSLASMEALAKGLQCTLADILQESLSYEPRRSYDAFDPDRPSSARG